MVGRRRDGGVGRRSSFGLFVVSVGLILALDRVQRIVDGKIGHGVGSRLMEWIAARRLTRRDHCHSHSFIRPRDRIVGEGNRGNSKL